MLRQFVRRNRVFGSSLWRWLSEGSSPVTEGESKITAVLKQKFPGCKEVSVTDISGGCGAMYEIAIEAEEFRGKRKLQQHMLVNKALETEIKDMHGLQIKTKVPS